MKQDYSLFY